VGVFFDLRRNDRSRTNEAHFAREHVPNLRQFVEARAPQPAANPCDARVAAELVIRLPLGGQLRVLVEILGKHGVCVWEHRAEFPSLEPPAKTTNALLSIKQ